MSAEKLSEAAAILAGLANKEVTLEVVETLNEMLGISKMDDTQLAAIANKAESIKRGDVETDETAEASRSHRRSGDVPSFRPISSGRCEVG